MTRIYRRLPCNTKLRAVYSMGTKSHKRNMCVVLDTCLAKVYIAYRCKTVEDA